MDAIRWAIERLARRVEDDHGHRPVGQGRGEGRLPPGRLPRRALHDDPVRQARHPGDQGGPREGGPLRRRHLPLHGQEQRQRPGPGREDPRRPAPGPEDDRWPREGHLRRRHARIRGSRATSPPSSRPTSPAITPAGRSPRGRDDLEARSNRPTHGDPPGQAGGQD